MTHPRYPNVFFEVFGDKLRTVIGNDPWTGFGVLFPSPLQNDLDILFQHAVADFPMHDVAAVSIKNGAQVTESPGNIDIRNIDMPMFVRLFGTLKAIPFAIVCES